MRNLFRTVMIGSMIAGAALLAAPALAAPNVAAMHLTNSTVTATTDSSTTLIDRIGRVADTLDLVINSTTNTAGAATLAPHDTSGFDNHAGRTTFSDTPRFAAASGVG